jgi:hypothetical protein
VAGVEIGEAHAFAEIRLLAVWNAFPELENGGGVAGSIERLHFIFTRRAAAAVEIVGVFLLNLGRIEKHNPGDFRRRRRAIDRLVVALADDDRQLAAMIEMTMGKDDRVDGGEMLREIFIQPARFIARALVHAAIEEQAQAVHFDEMA